MRISRKYGGSYVSSQYSTLRLNNEISRICIGDVAIKSFHGSLWGGFKHGLGHQELHGVF